MISKYLFSCFICFLWSFMNHKTRVEFHILFTTFPTTTPVRHHGEDSRVSAIFQKSCAPPQTSFKRSIVKFSMEYRKHFKSYLGPAFLTILKDWVFFETGGMLVVLCEWLCFGPMRERFCTLYFYVAFISHVPFNLNNFCLLTSLSW